MVAVQSFRSDSGSFYTCCSHHVSWTHLERSWCQTPAACRAIQAATVSPSCSPPGKSNPESASFYARNLERDPGTPNYQTPDTALKRRKTLYAWAGKPLWKQLRKASLIICFFISLGNKATFINKPQWELKTKYNVMGFAGKVIFQALLNNEAFIFTVSGDLLLYNDWYSFKQNTLEEKTLKKTQFVCSKHTRRHIAPQMWIISSI